MLDVEAAIGKAVLDPELRKRAAKLMASLIDDGALNVSDRAPDSLRGSDMGRCTLDLWYEIHGFDRLPRDVRTQYCALDPGSILGAWAGALLKASIEADGGYVELEKTCSYRGMPGHIDAFVTYNDESTVVDFKHAMGAYDASPPDKENRKNLDGMSKSYNIYQVIGYAMDPTLLPRPKYAVVCQINPGSRKKWIHAEAYSVADWEDRTDIEIERLQRALEPEVPEGDPQQAWRCELCQAFQCPRNPQHSLVISEASF